MTDRLENVVTPEEVESLVEFEKSIQWQWSSGDPTGYMDALAEDVNYVDPLAEYVIVGREAVRAHFKRIHTGPSGIIRQEYLNEIARPLSDDEVLLIFTFNTYQPDDNGGEKLFLSWNMSEIFRKTDGQWQLRHAHLSLRNAFDPDSIPKLRDSWLRSSVGK
ncbi:YybH family protein [Streptomyces rhizosphaerihabitans]|uniref:YybH family protein n=1 Tax=Streptomyces rhizosphaerihabitans TaxID=1266770 RepID=UPI0021BFC5B4|nr:nuclear transport factor 2 family protein [Streptomyces rhizosphaerihabitans]MCT9007114.1 nuclear transport factor 2 family protein [Streptomyces rhizosphaerihabitans]